MFSGKIILATLASISNSYTTENSFRAYIENFTPVKELILTENNMEEVPIIEEYSPFVDFEEIDLDPIKIIKHDVNDYEDEVSIQWPYLKHKYCESIDQVERYPQTVVAVGPELKTGQTANTQPVPIEISKIEITSIEIQEEKVIIDNDLLKNNKVV